MAGLVLMIVEWMPGWDIKMSTGGWGKTTDVELPMMEKTTSIPAEQKSLEKGGNSSQEYK